MSAVQDLSFVGRDVKNMTAGKLLGTALVLGVAAIVSWSAYDPQIEIYPGRKIARSQAEHTLAVWDAAVPGREPNFVNRHPKPSGMQPLNPQVPEMGER